ncbi:MAG TPA: DUF2231 domain-containing protein [Actinomycetota bacterium]|nr:DUF2231 domain-containing protein [Actinomycetota bacterium]
MFHRFRTAAGEERPWTLLEIVQGRPLRHPSHALFVHFPVAYYLAVLAFDVATAARPSPGLVFAGTLLLVGAFAASALAVTTGLVDWWQMVPSSRKRRWATRHMLFQLGAFGLFLSAFLLRWPHRHDPSAHVSWLAVEALGALVLLVGQWLGGVLVYEMAMRVSTGRRGEPERLPTGAPGPR